MLRSFSNQARALSAFNKVSIVVKVLLEIIIRVVSGFKLDSASFMSVPSTLETKCVLIFAEANSLSAVHAILGPKSEPPMPMFITSVIGFPVSPTHSLDLILSLMAFILDA